MIFGACTPAEGIVVSPLWSGEFDARPNCGGFYLFVRFRVNACCAAFLRRAAEASSRDRLTTTNLFLRLFFQGGTNMSGRDKLLGANWRCGLNKVCVYFRMPVKLYWISYVICFFFSMFVRFYYFVREKQLMFFCELV